MEMLKNTRTTQKSGFFSFLVAFYSVAKNEGRTLFAYFLSKTTPQTLITPLKKWRSTVLPKIAKFAM